MLSTEILDGTDIVTMTYDGAIGEDDVIAAREQIRAAAAGAGGARALLDVHGIDLGKVEPKAVWEDLKSAGLLGDVDRMAVLTDSTVIGGAVKAAGILPSLDTKVYEPGQRDEAVLWLRS